MVVSYVNRKGDTYYLCEGRTPKGNPKFYFSSKKPRQRVATIPDGYEIYEKPDSAQVFLRRIVETEITPDERRFVLETCRRLTGTEAVLVDVTEDSLVVYFADAPPAIFAPTVSEEAVEGILRQFGGNVALRKALFGDESPESSLKKQAESWRVSRGTYLPLLRFTLTDQQQRLFAVDRWCFRGSIDDWFPLSFEQTIDEAVLKYAPHLGRESFFDLC